MDNLDTKDPSDLKEIALGKDPAVGGEANKIEATAVNGEIYFFIEAQEGFAGEKV